MFSSNSIGLSLLQAFQKDNRSRLGRKELFKNTLRKATYAWKRIIELRLTGPSGFNLGFDIVLHFAMLLLPSLKIFLFFYDLALEVVLLQKKRLVG